MCIITEFAYGGDLYSLMKKKVNFTEDEAMHFFSMILVGLHHLHSKNIVHRDLKPANILINRLKDELFILKIGDFGISKNINDLTITLTLKENTTPAYKSPENFD